MLNAIELTLGPIIQENGMKMKSSIFETTVSIMLVVEQHSWLFLTNTLFITFQMVKTSRKTLENDRELPHLRLLLTS